MTRTDLLDLAEAELAKYHPCFNGLHVCGIDTEQNGFFTKENFPLPRSKVKAAFAAAKAECADQDGDYVVDMMKCGDCSEDFWIRAQMLPRLAALLRAYAETVGG